MIRHFLYNDRFLISVLLVLFLLVDATAPIQSLERQAYDWSLNAVTRPSDERITLITIDDASIARLGPWPWPKQIHARLLEILTRSEPKVIAFTFPFLPAPVNPGLALLNRIKSYLETLPPEDTPQTTGPDRKILHRLLDEGLQTLNEDQRLADAIKHNGHVILTMPALSDPTTSASNQTPPPFLAASALPPLAAHEANAQPLSIQSARIPMEILGTHAAGTGVELLPPDPDNTLRSLPILLRFQDALYPSLALAVAIHYKKSGKDNLQLYPDGTLQLGGTSLRTQSHWQLRPYFHAENTPAPALTSHSFHAILDGSVPLKQLRDQIILVGLTADSLVTPLSTPASPRMTPLHIQAQTLTAILHHDHFLIPNWAGTARYAACLIIALLLIIVRPRKGFLLPATLITSLVAALLLFLQFRLLSSHSLWVPLIGPLTLLISGHGLLFIKHWLIHEPTRSLIDQTAVENNRMLGLALQGQKQLDAAYAKFTLCPMDPVMMGILDHLAQDFENALQFTNAVRVYQRMAEFDPRYSNLEQRLQHAITMADQEPDAIDQPITMTEPGQSTPYQTGGHLIIQELATDPQGKLLLGENPQTQQRVVLRTFNPRTPDYSTLAREQLAHESEMLLAFHHPGVVALLAVGAREPQPYVVMETFPTDKTMEQYTHPETLLPLPALLHATTQMAMTLDKVHQQGITHGNLRPEELIYTPHNRQVKIKEFGIARFTGTHPGGSGICAYAAPEAVINHPIDQRADLYALGAILFHLLTGHPPFKADDPETLRNQILTAPPPTLNTLLPHAPQGLAEILTKALQKLPNDRYQRGADMARDLVQFVKSQVRKTPDQNNVPSPTP